MRYELGPGYTRTKPVPAVASPTGKLDPTITHKSDDGVNATFTVSPYDLATSNHLMELRHYLVPDGDPNLPQDGDAYVASAFPFGHADVSGLLEGGDASVSVPQVADLVSHAQYVLGYDQ